MRRVTLLALSVLMMVSMALSPALADDRDRDCWDEDWHFWACDRDRHDNGRHDDGRDDDVFFVPFFVQKGSWDWDPFWGWFWVWFWVECGGDWDC